MTVYLPLMGTNIGKPGIVMFTMKRCDSFDALLHIWTPSSQQLRLCKQLIEAMRAQDKILC